MNSSDSAIRRHLLPPWVHLAAVLVLASLSSGCFVSLHGFAPGGKGKGDNEFDMGGGIAAGWQFKETDSTSSAYKGTRVGAGYATAKNRVGEENMPWTSETEGEFMTPIFFESYGNIVQSKPANGVTHGLQWLAGAGWHMLNLDDADDPDQFGSLSAGIGYQLDGGNFAFDVRYKLSYLFLLDLEQDFANEIGVVFGF